MKLARSVSGAGRHEAEEGGPFSAGQEGCNLPRGESHLADHLMALSRTLHTPVIADGSRRCIRCGKNAPTADRDYTLPASRARCEMSRLTNSEGTRNPKP
jgi:hypothetical protein